jgi:NAD(P)-dependent dehydrogenase (short-subunit alcohol dehydrogenase family)
MSRLQDKKAVITGAASGLGLAATKLFAAEGAKVLAVDMDLARLEGALAGAAGDITPHAADLTDPAQAAGVSAAAVATYGSLDILLPNAGIWGVVAPFADYPDDVFRKVIEVNLTSVFYTIKYAIPYMVANGCGSIVMTSSAGGLTAQPGNPAYAATKHAALGLMTTVAVEYSSAGIRINAVAPGTIDTPMIHELERTFSPGDPAQGAAQLYQASLLGRYGQPSEVAEMMLYLASDNAGYVTGGVFYIDGGMQLKA